MKIFHLKGTAIRRHKTNGVKTRQMSDVLMKMCVMIKAVFII